MTDTHKSASAYIGNNLAGLTVGQMDYDWAFHAEMFYNPINQSWTAFQFGVQDATTFNTTSMNGAWGAWKTVPTLGNLYSYALAAGTYVPIGVQWNTIDDALETGSQGFYQYSDYDERIAKWNEWLDTIDTQVSWIWGNVRSGGCGFLKYDNNSVFTIASYGTYTKEINGQTEYKIASTSSNTIRGLDYWQQDGCFVVWCQNEQNFDVKIAWTTKNSWTGITSGNVYVASDPEMSDWSPNTVVYSGHETSLSDALTSGTMLMSRFGNTQTVYTPMISMGTIGSPYNGYDSDMYYPEHTIDDASWDLSEFDDGISENLSLGGGDDDNDGDGNFDNSSDDIAETDLGRFTVDAQDCGFVTVYKVPKETLKSFGSWLFSSHPTSFWDWMDEIKKIWDNPMDCLMSLNLCAYNANTGGEKDISFFGEASGFKAPIVDGLTQIFDCGYLKTEDGTGKLREYSGNFLDYGAKSTIKIFVPYCGTFSLATNEVMGAKLHLQYVIDLLTGACVAELTVHRDRGYVTEDPNLDSVLYRFNGNIFQQIPIGASSYGNILTGQLGLAGAAMSAVTGNVMGAVSGVVNSALSMSPQVERVGNCGTSYGYMSTQIPFIIQEYPWYNWNDLYDNYYGRPLYKFMKIGECDGFTEIDTDTLWADFDGITQEEEDMLKSILNSGGIYMEQNNAYTNYEP